MKRISKIALAATVATLAVAGGYYGLALYPQTQEKQLYKMPEPGTLRYIYEPTPGKKHKMIDTINAANEGK
jgi:hypothetical protein